MSNILDDLDIVSQPVSTEKEEPKQQVSMPTLGTVNYSGLKKMAGNGVKLFAVLNTAETDLVCDWDLPLMPTDLRADFDKYLSEKYNQYRLSEVSPEMRLVAISFKGQSINFLHQFMTEKRVPVLETVVEGASSSIKSQFVIPAKATVIATEAQLESLKRYEKKRNVVNDKASDWFGFLVFKEIPVDQLDKVQYSVATTEDLRNNNFVLGLGKVASRRAVSANMELSDELDNLF